MSYDKSALTTSQKAGIIKKALKKEFHDAISISVTKGKGTASGWITTNIVLKNFACSEEERRSNHREDSDLVRDIARGALRGAGTDFYTFSSDDGYGSEMECHSITVSYK